MMNNAQLAAASFDDIVFDGRNKGYGAYELRQLYQRHVSRALGIGSSIFALLISFPLVAAYLKEPVAPPVPKRLEKTTLIILPPIDPRVVTPPPPVVPVRPVTPPLPVATVRSTDFRVTRDQDANDKVPDVDELRTKVIGDKDVDGPPATSATIDPPVVEVPKATEGVAGPPAPYVWVEQMPELPGGGGQAAIVAAILKAVRYPGSAMRNGIEGKLYASFVVNALGEVVDVKIVKSLGYGLDEESIRAIKSLPRFIPGKQNGREVSVQYTVPITYKIQ